MRILLVGPPGAGKGTQARKLSEDTGSPHIASGDLLRAAIQDESEAGAEAKAYVDRGDLVPDDVVVRIVAERLEQPDTTSFVLDGFPRTEGQAVALDEVLSKLGRPLQQVIHLEVPDDEIVERLAARRYCPTCSRPYHMIHDPPRSDELCDDDGAKLQTRPDDEPHTVRHRLAVQYHEPIGPLLNHYKARSILTSVEGCGTVDEVAERIAKVAEEFR